MPITHLWSTEPRCAPKPPVCQRQSYCLLEHFFFFILWVQTLHPPFKGLKLEFVCAQTELYGQLNPGVHWNLFCESKHVTSEHPLKLKNPTTDIEWSWKWRETLTQRGNWRAEIGQELGASRPPGWWLKHQGLGTSVSLLPQKSNHLLKSTASGNLPLTTHFI